MTENTSKDCPYCAEAIKPGAKICPHCRSTLEPRATPETYRNREGRQIAGVSIALAEAFGVSVTFVRLAFIVLTFVNFIGPLIYVVLWALLPAEPHGLSPLGQLVTGKDGGAPSIFQQMVDTISGFLESIVAWFRKPAERTSPAGEIPTAEGDTAATEPPPPPPPPPPEKDPDKPAEGAP